MQSLIDGIFYQNLSETVSKLRDYQSYRKTLVFDLCCEWDLKVFLSNISRKKVVRSSIFVAGFNGPSEHAPGCLCKRES